MAIAKLSIDLEARLARLEGDLGRATALVERQSTRMESSFAKASRAAKGIGAAIVSGLGAVQFGQFLRDTATYAQQVERLATLSNQSTQEFQRQAEAARSVGIDADKLGDIFKDVQDKVGDFLQNGAGPLQDFFNNIAPRVGVTAEQFRKLGGADALQLYVNSLEKANLSQAEMTFFLEAIASDSTLLLPLLRNNGAAFRQLGDEAERTGVILDTKALAAAQEFQRNLNTLDQTVSGLARSIAGPLITALNELFAVQKRVSQTGGASAFGAELVSEVQSIRLKAAVGIVEDLQTALTKDPGNTGLAAALARARENADRLLRTATGANERLKELVGVDLSQGRRTRPANEGGGRLNLPPDLPDLPIPDVRIGNARPASAARALPQVIGVQTPEALADALKRIEQTDVARLAALREQLFELVTLTAQGEPGAAAALPALAEEIAALDPAGRAAAEGLQLAGEQAQRLNALLSETADSKVKAVTDDITFLNEQFAAGKIASVDQWAEAVRNATGRLGEANVAAEKGDSLAKDLGLTFSSAAEDAVVNFTSLRDVLKGLEQDLLRIFARKLITEPLANAATSFLGSFAGGGSSGGSAESTIGAIFASFLGSAKGNAFGPAGVMAFANGGVVSSPTLFGFGGNRTGIMGEAGPEAILPLQRGRDGKLGVAGGGGQVTNITVNVQAQPGMSRETAQQQGLAIGRGIQQSLARNG